MAIKVIQLTGATYEHQVEKATLYELLEEVETEGFEVRVDGEVVEDFDTEVVDGQFVTLVPEDVKGG